MPIQTYYSTIDTPLGELWIAGGASGLSHINLPSQRSLSSAHRESSGWQRDETAFADAKQQLSAYFAGELKQFDLQLAPQGTEFRQAVWAALRQVPWGETVSYAAIARAVGKPKAVRAVGAANGANPLPIVVPCHRVIGANGQLTGYAGGLHIKQFLLELEGSRCQQKLSL